MLFLNFKKANHAHLQLWMTGSFCQSGTSSLTSVTSYFSHLLNMGEGNGKKRKNMLIGESVISRCEYLKCVCVKTCWTAAHDDRRP